MIQEQPVTIPISSDGLFRVLWNTLQFHVFHDNPTARTIPNWAVLPENLHPDCPTVCSAMLLNGAANFGLRLIQFRLFTSSPFSLTGSTGCSGFPGAEWQIPLAIQHAGAVPLSMHTHTRRSFFRCGGDNTLIEHASSAYFAGLSCSCSVE